MSKNKKFKKIKQLLTDIECDADYFDGIQDVVNVPESIRGSTAGIRRIIDGMQMKKIEGSKEMKKNYRKVELKTGEQGLFHCWGLDMVEFLDTAASFSMAIVEMPGGSCRFVHPADFKFIDQTENSDV